MHLGAVDGEDDVAALHTGGLGGPALLDVGRERAARRAEAHGLGERLVERLDVDAEATSLDMSVGDELREHVAQRIGRDGEADALTGRVDRGVDADDLTARIEQRSAAVARIDRSVGLDEVVVRTGAERTALGADDSHRDRMAEAERIADGDDVFADLQRIVSGPA